jgi:hypothetical protein
MGGGEHTRRRRGLLRTLLLTGTLAGSSVLASAAPVSAGIDGCILTANKPGTSGLKAFGKFSFGCFIGNLPFQYQVALFEKDSGPDTRLSLTGWKDATTPPTGSYAGKGPKVLCNTESGNEELYTKVRVKVGDETSAWDKSAALTNKSCQ